MKPELVRVDLGNGHWAMRDKAAVARAQEIASGGGGAHWGPPLWCELHAGASTPAERRALVERITTELGRHAVCRKHWLRAVKKYPPAVDTAEAFFAWGVEQHNEVNRRLGKPEMTLEAAGALHSAAVHEP